MVNSLGVQIGPDGAGTDVGLGDLDVGAATPSDLAIFTGGAVAFTGAFIDATGGFDERWFLYYEDVDLARRGAELGWRYRLVPSAVVEHHGGVTTSAMADRTRFLQERNRLWSAFRHEPPATIRRAMLAVGAAAAPHPACGAQRGRSRQAWPVHRECCANAASQPGNARSRRCPVCSARS